VAVNVAMRPGKTMATQLLEDLLQKCHKPPFTMIVPAGHLASGLKLNHKHFFDCLGAKVAQCL
jgi:hypothetical protein